MESCGRAGYEVKPALNEQPAVGSGVLGHSWGINNGALDKRICFRDPTNLLSGKMVRECVEPSQICLSHPQGIRSLKMQSSACLVLVEANPCGPFQSVLEGCLISGLLERPTNDE